MTISNLETAKVNGPCNCTSNHGLQETETLRQMIADGMDQWEASIRLWGPATSLTDRARLRAWVRSEFLQAFPWLKLPPTTQPSGAA